MTEKEEFTALGTTFTWYINSEQEFNAFFPEKKMVCILQTYFWTNNAVVLNSP